MVKQFDWLYFKRNISLCKKLKKNSTFGKEKYFAEKMNL